MIGNRILLLWSKISLISYKCTPPRHTKTKQGAPTDQNILTPSVLPGCMDVVGFINGSLGINWFYKYIRHSFLEHWNFLPASCLLLPKESIVLIENLAADVKPTNKTFSQKFPASKISGNPDFDQKIKTDGENKDSHPDL